MEADACRPRRETIVLDLPLGRAARSSFLLLVLGLSIAAALGLSGQAAERAEAARADQAVHAAPAGLADSCRDESESGAFLAFRDIVPGVVLIQRNPEIGDDYPGFAIERRDPPETKPSDATIRFVVLDPEGRVAPQVLVGHRSWAPLPVVEAPPYVVFRVTALGGRTVVRLWEPVESWKTWETPGTPETPPTPGMPGGGTSGKKPQPEEARDKEDARDTEEPPETEEARETKEAGAAEGAGGASPKGATPLPLGTQPCASACYAPTNVFCYDFERLRCYLGSLAGNPHAEVKVLGWTRPCPGQTDHVPREIFKVRITDPTVPPSSKERIAFTCRVHGAELLGSFIAEGLMDYALGRTVLPAGGTSLPALPPTPADLLRRLELIIYPNLNPDGSADSDGDGYPEYDRYKCGVDMNRSWGKATEGSEAYEVHLVHEDLLREAGVAPFVYHRDLHLWDYLFQGGARNDVGTWPDSNGGSPLIVTQEDFDRETEYLQIQALRIPYRAVSNYLGSAGGFPPTPGSARFVISRELGDTGLLSDTSESAYVKGSTGILSDPPYRGGDDLRHEGAWLLLALYETPFGSPVTPPPPPASGPIIVDDGQPGTTPSGGWSVSGAPSPYGGRSLYSKSAGDSYSFRVPLPAPGAYDVSLWWTEWPSRLDAVPVEIQHSSGTATVRVNQKANGGRWNILGSWTFGSSALITIRSLGVGSTCADAVKLAPAVTSSPASLVLDNGQAGTSSTGSWSVSGAPNPYGRDSLYSKSAGDSYSFRVPLPGPGAYDVSLWWTEWPSRLDAVPVEIQHSSGTATVRVNQKANGGKWNLLGTWTFGSSALITIRSLGVGSTCADSVKLAPGASSTPASLVLDNGQAGTSSTGSWSVSGAPNPYGRDSLYSKSAGDSYSFRVPLPAPGAYDVSLWWTEWPSRLEAVPVEIQHASGTATVRVNQKTNGGKWNLLGTWTFGSSALITIRSLGVGSTCADSVRLVRK